MLPLLVIPNLKHAHCNVPTHQLQALAMATGDTTILCTHHDPMETLNARIMTRLYPRSVRHACPMLSTTGGREHFHEWLRRPGFHELPWVALGARVMLTANRDISKGAVNGAVGTIVDLEWGAPPAATAYPGQAASIVLAIKVQLQHSGDVLRFTRTRSEYMYADQGRQYIKSTFPLALAYAMTGHKAQGATITGPVVLQVTDAFAPGLMYVMVSRVQTRDQLHLLQRLTPDMFTPMSAI